MHKKLIALVIIVIIFLVSASAAFFLFFSQPKIKVVDQSQYYSIEYKGSEFFEENLDEWNVWEEDGIFLEADGNKYKIKNFIIYATDTPQPYHTFHSEGIRKGDLLFSTDESITKGGTLELKVYINPEVVKKTQENDLTTHFLLIALARISDMSLHEGDDDEKFQVMREKFEEYKADPTRIPFIISKP